jgi:nucleoside-diphosphate-sugar epimerase
MRERLFLAGATGAVGQRLVPLLVAAGYEVHGSTRHAAKAAGLHDLGAHAVVLDVYDATALSTALAQLRPTVVVHQLTDLPPQLDPSNMADAIAKNARVRREGTANLVAAAVGAGCRHLVAQSIAWAYAAGDKPFDERQPLDLGAEGSRAVTVGGVSALEAAALGTPDLCGAVLRYGNLYGPGTGSQVPVGASPVHVDAAAFAALLAVQLGAEGIFNIAEPNETVSTAKAEAQLGWYPSFRIDRSNSPGLVTQ